MKEKDSIQGAYLLLKRYKNRLKVFDETLQRVEKSKVNLVEFDALKASIDKTTATQIYHDMETLFDTTVKEMKKQM